MMTGRVPPGAPFPVVQPESSSPPRSPGALRSTRGRPGRPWCYAGPTRAERSALDDAGGPGLEDAVGTGVVAVDVQLLLGRAVVGHDDRDPGQHGAEDGEDQHEPDDLVEG